MLERCNCGGFLPRGASSCPHCRSSRLKVVVGTIGAVVGGGTIAFTLMACYGAGCVNGDTCDGDYDGGPATVTPPDRPDAAASDAGLGSD